MANIPGKNSWALLLLVLSGVVIGGFLGYLAKDIPWLSWLNYGQSFGVGSSNGTGVLVLDLGILVLSFGLSIKITIAGILGIMAAILIYRRI